MSPSAPRWPALRQKNFRRYFAGQTVSILGSWIQTVAMSWLVYRLTGSAALLGITAFLSQAPQLLISPLAGVWIDRRDPRRMMIGVQYLLVLQAALLAGLTFAGLITPWLLIGFAALQGVLNSFDVPLRQTILVHLLDDRRALPNAISLNAAMFGAGRFIGPPLAGLLVGVSDEATCFAINALSYVGLIVVMAGMHLPRAEPRQHASVAHAFREGLGYAWHTPPVRTLLISLTVLNLTASSYVVLMPVFAKEVFSGDARTLGWLLGAAGGGALSTTLWLSSHGNFSRMGWAVWLGWQTCAIGLLGFNLVVGLDHSAHLALALPMMFLLGAGIAATNVASNACLQGLAPDQLRGRVVSMFSALRWGMDAVGGLIAGLVAEHYGVRLTLWLEVAVMLVAVTVLGKRLRRLRRQVN